MSDNDDIPQLEFIEDAEDKKVPLTILTGYLGAGKSTLISNILTENHGHKIAVIVNEFGDTADIEKRAINISTDNESSEEYLELDNGCLCCSIRDEGVAAIAKLMKKKGKFDYILLETTGLADPSGLAGMFWENELFIPDIYLDGVVCVVDAKNVMNHLNDNNKLNECVKQIASADSIIINKVDMINNEMVNIISQSIDSINESAARYLTNYCKINLNNVINLNAYNSSPNQGLGIKRLASNERHSHSHSHNHLFGISSITMNLPILTNEQVVKFDKWLRSLLWDNVLIGFNANSNHVNREILRCKGKIITNDNNLLILQGVRDLYEMKQYPNDNIDDDNDEQTKVVIIGKELNYDEINDSIINFIS